VPAVTGDEGVASLEIAIRCLETPARPAPRGPVPRGRHQHDPEMPQPTF
jgi:hypothetical protein